MDKKLNYEIVFDTLVKKTQEYIESNHLKAMILGISGGIDSTVVAAICHEVSKQTGIPLIGRSLPIKNKNDEFSTSKLVGEAFCDNFEVTNLYEVFNKFLTLVDGDNLVSLKRTPIADGNIQARLRMIYLYNLASIHKGLVLSTDNQTEYQLGFWTIHGDVGDFDPLQDLWKTEVYGLAEYLRDMYLELYCAATLDKHEESREWELYWKAKFEAMEHSIALTPTDGLGISNSDLEQIGAKSYTEVDDILQTMLLYENPEREKWDILYSKYGEEVVNKVWNRHLASEFKRKNLPVVIERELYI
jgi:NAD+ synthetase